MSAVLVAMGVLMTVLGSVIDLFDLTASALCSLLVAFAYIEIGSPYTYLVFVCTAALSAVLFPGSFMWVSYLFIFGSYPILKGYIERLGRALWLPLKLIYAAIASSGTALMSSFVLGVPLVEGTLLSSLSPILVYGALGLLSLLAFVLYDYFLTVLIRYYFNKLRPRLKHLFK